MILILVGFGVALVILALLWRKTPWFLFGMRAGVLLVVLLLLINPGCSIRSSQKPKIVVVADVSPSMAQVVQWEDSVVRSLENSEILQVSEAARAGVLPLKIDTGARFTDLSTAFSRAPDAYVLISDGLHNSGLSVQPDAPVFVLMPPKTRRDNLSLVSVDCPWFAEPGRQMPVEIHMRLTGKSWRGRCKVVWGGKTVVDTGLSLEPPDAHLRFSVEAGEPGRRYLSVKLIPDSGVKDDPVDNAFSRSVQVKEGGIRLWVMAGRPHPVVGAIRQACENVPGLKVVSYVKTMAGWIRLAGDTVKRVNSPPKPDGPVIFATGSSKQLARYQNSWPKMVFLDADPWKVPGARKNPAASAPLSNAPGREMVPDSLLKRAPPVKGFWQVPASSATRVILNIGPFPGAFFRGNDMFVATPDLRAQNIATDQLLFNGLLSEFLNAVNRKNLKTAAWYDPATNRVMASVQKPDGSPYQGVWPRLNRKPMNRLAPGLFAGPGPTDTQAIVSFYRGDTMVASKRLHIEPSPVPAEAFDYGVDTAFLSRLASGSGGSIVPDTDSLMKLIAPVERRSKVKLSQMWILFALVVGLALGEWGMRRWRGMA